MSYPSLISLLGRLKASGTHTIFDIAPTRHHQPVATSFETTSSETDSPDSTLSTATLSLFEVPSAILAASIVAKGDMTGEEVQKFAVRLQRQQIKIMTVRAEQEAAKRRS
jgi:hypothetical protein